MTDPTYHLGPCPHCGGTTVAVRAESGRVTRLCTQCEAQCGTVEPLTLSGDGHAPTPTRSSPSGPDPFWPLVAVVVALSAVAAGLYAFGLFGVLP